MSRAKTVAKALTLALLFTLLTFPALAESEPFAEGGNGDAGLPVEHGAEVRGPFKDEDLPDFHLIYRKTPTPEPAPTPEPEAAGEGESTPVDPPESDNADDGEADVVMPGDDFYYYDEVGVLSDALKGEIYFSNKRLFEDCGAQIVVVVLKTTGTASIDDYCIRLFNRWGIGDREKNNGFLLLAIDDEDYYACPGSGLKDVMSPQEISAMLFDNLESDFAAGRYDSGVKRMYEALFQRIASICGSDAKIQEGAEANRLN